MDDGTGGPGRRWSETVRQASAMEVRQYAALVRWVGRRPDVPAEATPLPYSALAAPMIWLFVLGSAVEVVVLHVLLRQWPPVRWPALVLGLWGLAWMVGFLAAYRTRPHVVDDTTLHVRAGAGVDLPVPLDLVDTVTSRERDLVSSARLTSIVDDERGRWCGVGVSGRTSLQLQLRAPLTIDDPRLGHAGQLEIDALGLWVDDPPAARAAIVSRG